MRSVRHCLRALVVLLLIACAACAQDPAPESVPSTEETTDVPSEGATEVTTDEPSEGATEVTTDVPSEGAMEPTTDSEVPTEPSTDVVPVEPTEPTTSEAEMPLTTVTPDVVRPAPGEFSAPPEEPTTGTRGQAATFRLKFEPTAAPRKLTESNSEQMKLILPPSIEGGPPEERSRLTTTTIISTVSFEAHPEGGWRQIESVHSFQRHEEGIAVPDPLVKVLTGAKLVTRLDANGIYQGVEDAPAFLAGLLQRAPDQDRPMLQAALSPEVIDHESRQGWQRKLGRYLSIPLRIGHPSFLVEFGELGEVGRMPYILCAIPSTIEPVNGKNCVKVDLVSFSASLKDGVMSGVPDEVESEFMAWVEGKDIPFSPPELSVSGAGEVLLELSGMATVKYENEETFHVSPARIGRPMGPPIAAEELTVKRVNKMLFE